MFVITHRSIVFSAAALLTVFTSAAAAQEAQSTPDPSRSQPAIQSAVKADDNDDAELVLAEPDFRVLNLPSTLRLPRPRIELPADAPVQRQSSAGQLQRECGQSVRARSRSGSRLRVPVRHRAALQAAVYRTAIDKTFQFYGKYDAVRQGDSVPVSLSALVSVEGADNFQERYSPRWAWPSREWSPTGSRYTRHRSGFTTQPRIVNIDRDTFFVGIGGRLRVSATVYLVGEVVPRASGYRPDKAAYGFAIEKRAGGHLFQLNVNNGQGTTFGQLARGGFSDSLYLGFNLARKFF